MNKFKTSAIEILKREKKPLHYKEITRLSLESGILETEGATPDASMNAQIVMDIKHKKDASDFIKTAPSTYALNPNKKEPVCSSHGLEKMKKRKITHSDNYQDKYIYYLTEPIGKNFDPEFKPQLTPKQMLRLGVFGGLYFGDLPSEFPKEWFKGAKLSPDGKQHKELNYFGVNASQPLSVWRAKGWIHPDDPRGWFQWYCRYYQGRRHKDDARQIKRWKAYRRHVAQVVHNCRQGDVFCRPKQRQSLLHWAYDARKL